MFTLAVHVTLPIGTASQGVSFAFIPFVNLNSVYIKAALTVRQQIDQLTERGLIISPEDNVIHFLNHISFRICLYSKIQ